MLPIGTMPPQPTCCQNPAMRRPRDPLVSLIPAISLEHDSLTGDSSSFTLRAVERDSHSNLAITQDLIEEGLLPK